MQINLGKAFIGDAHRSFTLAGKRGAALLIHGFPGTPAEVRSLGAVLHGQGLTVHAPLLPGFGPEIDNLAAYSHRDWLSTTEGVLLDLETRHETIILGGYSMGGALALSLAARQRVDGLVLMAPFTQIPHLLWYALPVIRVLMPRIKVFRLFRPDFADSAVRDGITAFLPGLDLDDPDVQRMLLDFALPTAILDEVRKLGNMGWTSAQAIDAPVLVLQGQHDETADPRLTRRLIERFKGSVQYVEIDTAHDLLDARDESWPQIETEITSFVRSIVDQG